MGGHSQQVSNFGQFCYNDIAPDKDSSITAWSTFTNNFNRLSKQFIHFESYIDDRVFTIGKRQSIKIRTGEEKAQVQQTFFYQSFVPSSPPAEGLLPNCDELEPYDPDERNLMFAQREPTLPDMTFVGGRLLIAAWDEGLDGSVNDPAASQLIVTAVHQLLKRIVLSLLADKSAFKTKINSKEPYAVGMSIPNPYLISRQQPQRWLESDKVANQQDEQSAIWELACAHRDAIYPATHPNTVTLLDLMDTLKKDRTLIPSHAVYSLNMERLMSRLHHED